MKAAQQPSLFPAETAQRKIPRPSQVSGLEAVVKSLPVHFNSMDDYGFSDRSLDSFLSRAKGNYEAARFLYYGIIDMEREEGIPHAVYQAMNTQDIAAMLIGAAALKELEIIRVGKEHIRYNELKDKLVEDIISALVQIGYKYNAIIRMRSKGYHKHSTRPGSLKSRIALLSSEVKEAFRAVFEMEIAVPNTDGRGKFDFYDTGDRLQDRSAAQIYTRDFLGLMSRAYRKKTQ